ncbi:ribonuclease H-like domain-containing protein, partial [Tanacetum coccineum]
SYDIGSYDPTIRIAILTTLLYPNHKLKPRTTPSILLGHASNHRGYRCLDLNTNKIVILRHVTFDKTVFPYGSTQPTSIPTYTFLDDSPNIPTQPIWSILVLDPDTIHATHTPPPNTTPTDSNISPSAQPESPAHPTLSHNSPAQQTPEMDHEQPLMAQNEISPLIIPNPPENPNPVSVHPMVKRFCVGSNQPTQCLNLHVSSVSPLPKSYRDAFHDSNWQNAMRDEYNALITKLGLFRYKARLVANGSTQLEGVDVDKTFSPVFKPGTIRTVLSLVVSRYWPIHQLDVKNAFLHGDLFETVYMHQPPGFWDSTYPDHVCLLQLSLYGLKQAPRAWFQRFASYITRVGFQSCRYDSSLFIYRHGMDTAYLLLYVDDFRKYVVEILEKAHMVNCNPSRTPVDTESKLGVDGDPVCLYMHDLREPYFSALKRILWSVLGTLEYGLQLFSSSTTSLVAYSDAELVGCPTTRRLTSGYCVFLDNNLLSWFAKRQPTLSRSSVEAEYRGVANDVAETCWLRNLLPLAGNYVNFGVFELYGDRALADALGIALKMTLSVPLADILAYRKFIIGDEDTTISGWIVMDEIDPYLGGAARRRVCSRDGSDTLISCPALAIMSQTRYHRYLPFYIL